MFIKKSLGVLGLVSLGPIISTCRKRELDPEDITNTTCAATPSETEGPFPTKSPSSNLMTDIRGDRTGVPLTITIKVVNKNTCQALQGAIVDIWHCDKDGYYSEYGNIPLQPKDYTKQNFLRGRQIITNEEGLVHFISIFPGWYPGRAPHIHVHVYNSDGNSLLTTQIAFPGDVCDKVYMAAPDLYTKGLHDTPNAHDPIFSDSLPLEVATVTKNGNDEYQLVHEIVVTQ
jgi:protocatechuate 3,4-dioxygenase beta subunit